MGTHLIDRLTSALGFRVLFVVSAVLVLPVLALGLFVTSVFFLAMTNARYDEMAEMLGFVSLSLGGAIGTLGWVLSLVAARNPERYNLTAIFVCLAVGVVTALVVTIYSIRQIVESIDSPWGLRLSAPGFGVFAIATTIWVLDGIGRMQVLARRYRERTGRVFDGLSVAMLLVALALAIMAALNTLTL
jgi:uncharacterized protein with PQ loop repeat